MTPEVQWDAAVPRYDALLMQFFADRAIGQVSLDLYRPDGEPQHSQVVSASGVLEDEAARRPRGDTLVGRQPSTIRELMAD